MSCDAKLHLGCGSDIRREYINADFMKLPGVDAVIDLNEYPWHWNDDTFGEVYTAHYLEHAEDLIKTMEEIHRVCENGSWVIIRVPHFSCGVSYRDPTHKRMFSYFTFDYFTKKDDYYARKESGMFKIVDRQLNFTRYAQPWLNIILNPLINLSPELYERFFCWMLPCSEVLVTLEVIK